ETCARLADQARAEVRYEALLPYAETNPMLGPLANESAVSRQLGVLATVTQRWGEAERHFEDALAMSTKMGARPGMAWSRYQYADMVLRRDADGDRKKAWMEVLREHNTIVRQKLKAHGGFEVKSEGDGFMVAFQSAGKALVCASAIQKALVGRNQSAEEAVLVRMGLHAGDVIKEGEDFFGRNVIMAARVASKAQGGEILASGVLKARLAGSDVSWGEKRTVELKGLSGKHEIWAVNWSE